MTDRNEPDDGMSADDGKEGFAARLRWTFLDVFRRYFPLTPEEIARRLEEWRRQAGKPRPDENGSLDAVANRCCVMRIPGMGTRCSSEPSTESQCRELARQYNGTAHFYPDRPCVDCTPFP